MKYADMMCHFYDNPDTCALSHLLSDYLIDCVISLIPHSFQPQNSSQAFAHFALLNQKPTVI